MFSWVTAGLPENILTGCWLKQVVLSLLFTILLAVMPNLICVPHVFPICWLHCVFCWFVVFLASPVKFHTDQKHGAWVKLKVAGSSEHRSPLTRLKTLDHPPVISRLLWGDHSMNEIMWSFPHATHPFFSIYECYGCYGLEDFFHNYWCSHWWLAVLWDINNRYVTSLVAYGCWGESSQMIAGCRLVKYYLVGGLEPFYFPYILEIIWHTKYCSEGLKPPSW